MTYDFATRLARNGIRMQTLHQNSGIYKRDQHEITLQNITPERVDVSRYGDYGLSILSSRSFNFVCDTSVFAGLHPAVPKPGDSFEFGGNFYEVMPIMDGQECYDFVTTKRDRIRVYLREITSVYFVGA